MLKNAQANCIAKVWVISFFKAIHIQVSHKSGLGCKTSQVFLSHKNLRLPTVGTPLDLPDGK
jgi:hypothetical protein